MPAPAEDLLGGEMLRWLRRHERRLALAWLGGTVVLLLAFLLPPSRDRLLGLAQSVATRWDRRWTSRIRHGEELVAGQHWAAAEAYLARLDREFPARNVRAGRDKDREHILRLLAQAQEAEGRTKRTLNSWHRLVAFDSLNYANHFGYAQAAERLLSGWAPAIEARDGYAAALAIFPSHLPSVRGYIEYYMARGEFEPVTEAWERYLEAWLVQSVQIALDDTTVAVRIPVDGLPHEVEIALPHPRVPGTTLSLSAGGFAFDVAAVELVPALRIGEPASASPRRLDGATIVGRNAHRSGAGWLPDSTDGALQLGVGMPLPPVARLRLRLTVFKPVDGALWKKVQTAYRNQLNYTALDRSKARTVAFPDVTSADSVIARQPWAAEGLAPDPDE